MLYSSILSTSCYMQHILFKTQVNRIRNRTPAWLKSWIIQYNTIQYSLLILVIGNSLLHDTTGSYEGTFRSPATSLSITEHAAHLDLMTEPLIPLPVPGLLDTDRDLSLDIAQSSLYGLFPLVPVHLVVLRDAATEPAAAGGHPLISTDLTGCPYGMTTYREEDIVCVDSAFEVQVHHPRFLECIGAPELSRLLGRQPADWLSVMDHRDVLVAAKTITVGRRTNGIKLNHPQSVCGVVTPKIYRGVTVSIRTQTIPCAHGGGCCAGATCVSGVHADDGDGALASTGWTPGIKLLGLCIGFWCCVMNYVVTIVVLFFYMH